MSPGTGLPPPLVIPNSGRWIGNDGSWSTFFVQVGTPPQGFHVLPSISGQTIYVPVDKDCEPERMNITDCGAQRGVEVFKSQRSLGFQRNESSTWNEVGFYGMGLGTDLGLTDDAYYGYDNVTLGFGPRENATSVDNLAVAAFMTPDIWVGQLGLSTTAILLNENNQSPSLLTLLKKEEKIPSLSFGYQAGSADRFTKTTGSLILGGYDRSRQSNNTLLLPLTPDLVVGVQTINVEFTNGTASTQILSDGIRATIDTSTSDIWLPPSVCDAFASALGLTYFQEADRYVIDSSIRSIVQSSSPTFSFVIGTSETGGATITIDIPYGAFDLQATYPIFAAPTYYFPIRRAANESQLTLGRAFLQEVYLSVDWERNIFNLSQALFNSPPLPQELVTVEPADKLSEVTPEPDQSNVNSNPLSVGAIVGIVVGSLAFILCLAALGWWLHTRRQKQMPAAKVQPGNSGATTVNEKEIAKQDSNSPIKGQSELRTDFELEGQTIGEMYAPYHYSGVHSNHGELLLIPELVEADSNPPILEATSLIHELPATENYSRRHV